MSYQVTHIRLSSPIYDTTQEITDVKLSTGAVESVQSVVKFIDQGMKYYYTDVRGSQAEIETVHPSYGDPYIRTKANSTTRDNLLSLPKF